MKLKRRIGAVVYHAFVIAFGFIMIYPLIWMVFSSFKETDSIFREAGVLIPRHFKLENYLNGWKGFGGVSFGVFMRNSLIVTVSATVGAVVSSAVIAFGFARLKFPGRKIWFSCVMLTMMLPFQVVMIPQFIIFQKLQWVNTALPLIIPHYFGGAFFIFLNMQFIKGIPKELDESAKIDGCSFYGIFVRIILPLIKPSLVTTAIFSFIWRWDDFFAALLYLNQPSKYTVSIALKMFSDPSSQSDYGAMFSMATVSILPIFVIFILFQKYLVEGISTEGLKG
ncbi:MAG: carbohydrate ABC transporter permease [Enterocloster asparagiformis]|nr:carbohydrate ABC transporter permease [Enterocloster asparagiformis]